MKGERNKHQMRSLFVLYHRLNAKTLNWHDFIREKSNRYNFSKKKKHTK